MIDEITLEIIGESLSKHQPKLVAMSVPFPGNLYSAFRCGQYIKWHHPKIKVAMGGGFPNTELRSVVDVRVFDYIDFITLDDGELPLELLISNINDPSFSNPNFNLYKRTFLRENNEVVYNNFSLRKDYKQAEVGTPDYSDLLLNQYISVIEIANPMHSLWSDGRWNKLTMAHGCYWGKCTFCDVSLDYIGKYEPVAGKLLVDRMEILIEQTGERGFHFVDEAAPPALMRDLALEILKRSLNVTWWTNIRFEKNFSSDLCRLLAASGCVAVSGGLEVASDRLLALIKKGVTVEQVAQVARNFTETGIMVHAYLMYGYPTQTVQETIDSLEMVRQLFEQGVIQSGFWHQFALTAHSPVGLDPDAYGIIPKYKQISFANNDVQFEDSTGVDHDQFSEGLKKSLFNYMHGIGFEFPLKDWFKFKIPDTSIDSTYIEECLYRGEFPNIKPNHKVVWLGSNVKVRKGIKGQNEKSVELMVYNKQGEKIIICDPNIATWLSEYLPRLAPQAEQIVTYAKMKFFFQSSPLTSKLDFTLFWFGEEISELRKFGLLVL